MAELHDSLVVALRKSLLRKGFKESKGPTPTYRPDIFAEKHSSGGKLLEQVVVEAEIESTLFSEHTAHQLTTMHDFIQYQKVGRIRVRGFLLVPGGKNVLGLATSLLDALFPGGTAIEIAQV